MRKTLFLLLSLFFTPLIANEPLSYYFSTEINSLSPHFFNLKMKQKIDFDCAIESVCPINQTPEKITLTFKRLRGEILYNDKEFQLDTDNEEIYSLEFQCLKKLLNSPIHISLNSQLQINESVEDLKHLLSLSTLEGHFISEDILNQIIELIFLPSSLKSANSSLKLQIYYPFKAQLNFPFETKTEKRNQFIALNEPLTLEGLLPTIEDPFSVHLSGNLEGKVIWKEKQMHLKEAHLMHKLKESSSETLFENPLSFEYTTHLKLIK